LETAIKNSTDKMGQVMETSLDRARKAVWGLFGVGSNYKTTGVNTSAMPPGQPIAYAIADDGVTKVPLYTKEEIDKVSKTNKVEPVNPFAPRK
jgi:hypothetical protein